MTKQETINKLVRFYDKNGATNTKKDFQIWYKFTDDKKKLMEKVIGIGMDDGELCAIGEQFVYPLEELSKRELEEFYAALK